MLSAMRSGSTLLKSLLANAPDTSHLPEVDFQKYATQRSWKLKTLSKARIIILKKPAPFDIQDYPTLPKVQNARNIVLVRDVYDTVFSVKRMIDEVYPHLKEEWTYDKLVHDYWYATYKNILDKVNVDDVKTMLVRYEDLTAHPLKETQRLFKFMGSEQKEGVTEYFPPKDFQWKWGSDDGGQKLKTLKIEASRSERNDQQLMQILSNSQKVQELRKHLNYDETTY